MSGLRIALGAVLFTAAMAPALAAKKSLAQQHPLYDAQGKAQFSLYVACRGERTLDNDQCPTVTAATREWSDAAHVFHRRIDTGAAVKNMDSIDPGQIAKNEPTLPLRVLLRFSPILIASEWHETSGMGGYTPPVVGYRAWIDVFDTRSGERLFGDESHKRDRPPQRADATPYIKADIAAVLEQLDAR